jgi:primosomal protein N' (replication factor Y) (superfamily II helicase)
VRKPADGEKIRVADVVIEAKAGGNEAVFTYRLDQDAELGDAFFVPLGARTTLGYVAAIREIAPEDLGFSVAQLRSVQTRVDGLSLPASLIELVRFVAEEYLCPLPVALGPATPPGVRERLVTAWTLIEDAATDLPLSAAQDEVLRALRDAGGKLIETHGKPLPSGSQKALKLLRGKGLVRHGLQLAPLGESRTSIGLLRLTADSDRVETFLKTHAKKKPAQALTIMRMQSADNSCLSAAEIKAMSGVTDATVRALLEAGILEKIESEEQMLRTPPQPNPAQRIAIDAIVDAMNAAEFRAYLLYGVTGSGKTEVYLRAAAEALRMGRQVLYLVPEIALATQAIAQLRERFGRRVAIIHSDLPPKERLDNWMSIRQGTSPVVLGARSALFAPLSDIGLIVVDEEHEASYKQESAPRYHSKQLALHLAKRHGAPVVFGSATPSVESFFEAESGSLTLLSLPQRAASAVLPSVYVEDLTLGYKTGKPSMFSDELHGRIEQTLKREEQVILFLNRRAYAPFLICRDCGQQFKCPSCAVSLAFSRSDARLRCHHCGYNIRPPEACPTCEGLHLKPFGAGTEKVEEAVRSHFPEARVARLDRDVARKKGALEAILTGFRAGDIDILVGTQMVAKGLDFPRVTLVGVIAADTSLNIPDFRASERTFQLLSQVAGRAGRGTAPGHVVIQTFNPGHVAVETAQKHDFLELYDAMKVERREARYPPFTRLVNVLLTGPSAGELREASMAVAELLRGCPDVEILGPTDCALERLQNKWRRHLLLKLPPGGSGGQIGERLKDASFPGIQVLIDVDPQSLV